MHVRSRTASRRRGVRLTVFDNPAAAEQNVGMPVRVTHVVSADFPAAKREVLTALLDADDARVEHALVQVGGGSSGLQAKPAARLTAPFNLPWAVAARLRRLFDRTGCTLIHVWTHEAARWCLPAVDSRRPLLLEVHLSKCPRHLARWHASVGTDLNVCFACPTAIAERRMIEHGVPAGKCVLIREFVDFARINRAKTAADRELLNLTDGHKIVLTLPPVERSGGQFGAAWSTLLVHVVRPDVRLLVPGVGREPARMERMVARLQQREAVRFTGERFGLLDLLAVTDMAIFMPPGDACVHALAWAMASATPIVASAVPAVTEMLSDHHNAWLCRPEDVKAAAARLLLALESPSESDRFAALARSQAFAAFGKQRMIRQYRTAYENLAAGREVGTDIVDASRI